MYKKAGSPAIDAGDSTDSGGSAVTTDQRGVSRHVQLRCDRDGRRQPL